jgi:hypothetical protein
MNAVRIRKFLGVPIPQLPELAPMIGKNVEIIVLEDSAGGGTTRAPARFDDLKGGWPDDQLSDGFEEALDRWRREPWRAEDALADAQQAEGS